MMVVAQLVESNMIATSNLARWMTIQAQMRPMLVIEAS
jgi:hypothetical protein